MQHEMHVSVTQSALKHLAHWQYMNKCKELEHPLLFISDTDELVTFFLLLLLKIQIQATSGYGSSLQLSHFGFCWV